MNYPIISPALQLSTPDRNLYSELAKQQKISRGSTRAVALPQALPGFVVNPSTLHGAPRGWKHSAVATQVIIDPDMPGETFTVDMSKVTPDLFNIAAHNARLGEAESIDDLCERAANVYRSIAQGQQPAAPPAAAPPQGDDMDTMAPLSLSSDRPVTGQSQQKSASGPPPRLAANPYRDPEVAEYLQARSIQQPPPPQQLPPALQQPPQSLRSSGPMPAGPSLFDRVAGIQAAVHPAQPTRQAGSAPTYKVVFEVKGSPMSLEAWYHDVIREEHVLVLVYDKRCTGYPRTRLQPTDNDIALMIEGSNSVYLVKDPGISFDFDGQEFQVLLIKETYPMHQGEAQPAV